MSERQAKFVTRQLFSALDYLHENQIVHRDIKPDNIMIDEIDKNENVFIKLIDFGFAKQIEEDEKLI